MKFSKRLLLLLLCFAVLSSAFSLVASASTNIIQIYSRLEYGENVLNEGFIYPDDSFRQTYHDNITFNSGGSYFKYDMFIENKDKTILVEKGSNFDVTLQNVFLNGIIVLPTADAFPLLVKDVSTYLVFYDGKLQKLDTEFSRNSEGYYFINIKCPEGYTVEKDVFRIDISYSFYSVSELSDFTCSTVNGFVFDFSFGEPTLDFESNQSMKFNSFSLSIQEEELGFIESIAKKISDVFAETKNLPKSIWTVFSDGIISLFVPDENTLSDIKSDLDSLASAKFGAVYQVVTLLHDMAEDVQHYDEVDSISVPEVTVDLCGVPFTFGGWNVKLIPDGFDFLVDCLKTIIGIVCTFAFIGGLRKRYDEVFR